MGGCNGGLDLAGLDLRKIHNGVGDVVHVIGENVEGDPYDDFDDLRVVKAGGAGGLDAGIGNIATLQGNGAGQLEDSVGFVVARGGAAGAGDVFPLEAGLAAKQGVGAKAVAAAIDLGDGEGHLLANFAGQDAVAEGAAKAEVPPQAADFPVASGVGAGKRCSCVAGVAKWQTQRT